jgi:endonuclease G, mitochondrial
MMNTETRALLPLVAVVALLSALALSSCVSKQTPAADHPKHTFSNFPTAAHAAAVHTYLFSDAPVAAGYPNSWTILTNVGYESAYDETFKNPAWVAYHISGTPIWDAGPHRPPYEVDLRSVSLVSSHDFPPGYDVGHMACNETIADFYGPEGQTATFLMTNMVPQKHGLNAGPWKSVERKEREQWVQTYHDVWTIAGPVYTTGDNQPISPALRFGEKQVCVPVACFKIIVAKDSAGAVHTLAFIMPQENAAGHPPTEFAVRIRDVEKRTGLNFFSSSPQAVQDKLELVTNKVL